MPPHSSPPGMTSTVLNDISLRLSSGSSANQSASEDWFDTRRGALHVLCIRSPLDSIVDVLPVQRNASTARAVDQEISGLLLQQGRRGSGRRRLGRWKGSQLRAPAGGFVGSARRVA